MPQRHPPLAGYDVYTGTWDRSLTGKRLDELYKIAKKKEPGLSRKGHAAAIGLPWRVYSARIEAEIALPIDPKILDLGKPFEHTGDAIIVGDVHVPTTDWELAANVSLIAKKHLQNPVLIIAGDFFNFDLFSSYQNILRTQAWAIERNSARAAIRHWLEDFQKIFILPGNHDRRVQKVVSGEFSPADILNMITGQTLDHDEIDSDSTEIMSLVVSNPERVRMSNFGYMTLQSNDQKYHVTHGREYSVNALTVANELAQKHQSHIISHHEHHFGITYDRYGRYLLINNGGLFNQRQFAYAMLDDTKKPRMKNGFTMVKGGFAYLFGKEPFTNWQDWI